MMGMEPWHKHTFVRFYLGVMYVCALHVNNGIFIMEVSFFLRAMQNCFSSIYASERVRNAHIAYTLVLPTIARKQCQTFQQKQLDSNLFFTQHRHANLLLSSNFPFYFNYVHTVSITTKMESHGKIASAMCFTF